MRAATSGFLRFCLRGLGDDEGVVDNNRASILIEEDGLVIVAFQIFVQD
jgi:hypothetical protein